MDELAKESVNILVINGTRVVMRPYVAKLKRVFFSNVLPSIPHDVIVDKLKENNITPKSNLSFMRVGTEKAGSPSYVLQATNSCRS